MMSRILRHCAGGNSLVAVPLTRIRQIGLRLLTAFTGNSSG
jgi:hypothetical protein